MNTLTSKVLAFFSHTTQPTMAAERYFRFDDPSKYAAGTSDWLIAAEKHYGGLHTNVKRRHVSTRDPRTARQIARGGMTGGDRMFHHGYANAYAEGLQPFLAQRGDRLTILEVGILRGTGLALWSNLFPAADIIGLDVDLGHALANLSFLKSKGAFSHKDPELHVFDQFSDDRERIAEILRGRTVDICIDDGFHSIETIMNTATALVPFLSGRFVYFVEDNAHVSSNLSSVFVNFTIRKFDQLTVMASH